MDVTHILDSLNDAQRRSVTAPLQNLLVLAGAGSGKTRVLVHRIAWLIETEGLSPYSILAVTFTNKAAREMRGRIEQLLGINTQGMWVAPFTVLLIACCEHIGKMPVCKKTFRSWTVMINCAWSNACVKR